MRQLKCVGGAADGKMVWVGERYGANDIINVPAKIEFKIEEFDPQDAYKLAAQAVPYYPYKICVLQYKDVSGFTQKLHYLIPSNWHEWEAIIHLFRSHVSYG